MEEKKAAFDNKTTDNIGKDFHFSGDGFENSNNKAIKQYGRDFLLQLRLHPLSLQKPKNLPDIEFIKEKLYLNHIGDSNYATDEKHKELNYYYSSLKPDVCNMKHDYQLLPSYYNRMYPYCFSSHTFNGNYQNSPKFRSPFHTYCNALKKSSCYRDYGADECLWAKRYYSPSEDIWSCLPSLSHSTPFKKQDFESVPKTKKKLPVPIIDPATGKNILESITKQSSEQENDFNANENLDSSENADGTSKYRNFSSYFCTSDLNNEIPNVSNDIYDDKFPDSPSEEKLDYKSSNEAVYQSSFLNDSASGDAPDTVTTVKKEISDVKEKSDSSSKETVDSTNDPNTKVDQMQKLTQQVTDNKDSQKLFNRSTTRGIQNTNTPSDVHSHCQNQHRKEFNSYVCKENILKQNDAVNESVKQLREKVYSLRQEQQKMAVLQSFLRYKKYQLEENARSLDEKKIEMANWEYSLFNKAKLLQEKEHWLESKSEILNSKAQQLAEKEKLLIKEKSKVSGDTVLIKNESNQSTKEFQFTEKKHMPDVVWENICNKIKNYKNDNLSDNEYSYFGYCSNQDKNAHNSSLSNVEKCKSDANTLDELEKNIVMMEKMHTKAEENALENKSEDNSSLSVQKTNNYEPLGCSKGRRYLPEPLKYWLNNRDKKVVN